MSISKGGNKRTIDSDFEGVNEVEIVREGASRVLPPAQPTWRDFIQLEKADDDFMFNREDVVSNKDRFDL